MGAYIGRGGGGGGGGGGGWYNRMTVFFGLLVDGPITRRAYKWAGGGGDYKRQFTVLHNTQTFPSHLFASPQAAITNGSLTEIQATTSTFS